MKKRKSVSDIESLKVGIDAIVMILLRSEFSDKKGKIKMTRAAPILHRAGYSPSEIAKLLGKKKSSEIAPYLYPKKKQ